MNPYAAPKAKLEEPLGVGTLWREGKLVRMDRDGALPDRCVICNEKAGSKVVRVVYWAPAMWRNASVAAPFVLLFGGIGLQIPLLAALFWPAVIVLAIAHFLIRKQLRLEMGICRRHRRQRNLLRGLSIGVLALAGLVFFNLSGTDTSIFQLFAAVAALLVVAVVQSLIGVQAVSVKKLDAQHAWLGGTGKPFREGLPELPG